MFCVWTSLDNKFPELDEAAQAELDAIQKKLGKYKGKYGKEIGIDELEWVKIFYQGDDNQ